jgi:hypothetical protein
MAPHDALYGSSVPLSLFAMPKQPVRLFLNTMKKNGDQSIAVDPVP